MVLRLVGHPDPAFLKGLALCQPAWMVFLDFSIDFHCRHGDPKKAPRPLNSRHRLPSREMVFLFFRLLINF